MSIACRVCGKESQDPEFCDYCNADLGRASQSLPPEQCPLLPGGAALTAEQRHALLFPEAWITIQSPEKSWRVHWISAHDWHDRAVQLEKRVALQISALPVGRLIKETQGSWLVMDAPGESILPWQQPAHPDPLQELQRLSAYVHSLTHAIESLHQNSFVWLNFDPNAIEDFGPLESSGSADRRWLKLTNLDVELFEFGSMPERVRVHPHYAAPEIVQFRSFEIGPRTDVFHLAMFAYYWLAKKLPDGLGGNGLEEFEYQMAQLRVFNPNLVEGIAPVVQRGISILPLDRHATPRAFAHALDEAIINAYRRRAFAGKLRWDVAGHTRTGRAKTELQRGNEDAILIKSDDQSALGLVADGVSTCDIGSGGLASMMTTIVMENALAEGCTHETFSQIVTAAARRGSEGLLEWALAHGCRGDLEAGKDLMGTTLTIVWLEGREISVANLGDSRVYLVTDQTIEQLTVDGDLTSDLLAQGAAPEDVRELGMMGRALRECVGGCAKNQDGEIGILLESCTPRISRWPVVPGDVIVVCSDGLVEEGCFLEPKALAEMVRRDKQLGSTETALKLSDAADALQRLPTILEPDGFGDNISCVVFRIMS